MDAYFLVKIECGTLQRHIASTNFERLRKFTENDVASNAKIKQKLEIDKMPVKAKDGLNRIIQRFENKIK